MSREVRRVPLDWQHPCDGRGEYIPLFDGNARPYRSEAEEWVRNCAAWDAGTHPDLIGHPERKANMPFFWEWDGNPPDPDRYTEPTAPETCVGWQMYETVSEGTPISPVCESAEALAGWLADNKASAFAGDTATYDQWLRMIVAGSAPTFISRDGGRTIISGVAAMSDRLPGATA